MDFDRAMSAVYESASGVTWLASVWMMNAVPRMRTLYGSRIARLIMLPTDVPIIDLMLAVPNDDTSNFYLHRPL